MRVVAGPGPAGQAARRGSCGCGHCRKRGGARRCPQSRAGRQSYRERPAPLRSAARSVSQIIAAARALHRERGGDRPAAHPRQGEGRCAALGSPVPIEATAGKRPGTWESERVCAAKQVTGGCVSVAELKCIRMPWGMSARTARATPQLPRTAKSRVPHGVIPALLTPRIRRFPTLLHMTRKLQAALLPACLSGCHII